MMILEMDLLSPLIEKKASEQYLNLMNLCYFILHFSVSAKAITGKLDLEPLSCLNIYQNFMVHIFLIQLKVYLINRNCQMP